MEALQIEDLTPFGPSPIPGRDYPSITDEEAAQIVGGAHPRAEALIGMQPVAVGRTKGEVVRGFFPGAERVNFVFEDDNIGAPKPRYLSMPMIRRGQTEIFETALALPSRGRHRFEVKEAGGRFYPIDALPKEEQSRALALTLFNRGVFDDVAHFMGSHKSQLDGQDGFVFRVWAPQASKVNVVGEFNGWDPEQHAMTRLGLSGVFEKFVPGVEDGQKYLYRINDDIWKSDPYARRTSLRPDTESITLAPSTYSWGDAEWMKRRAAFDAFRSPVATYEVHLPSWKQRPGPLAKESDKFLSYTELAQEVPAYAKSMNFTHLELFGLQEHQLDVSFGYLVQGFYAPTARHGHPDGFKAFVDACHQNGLGVFLDYVVAHHPKDEKALGFFDGSNCYEHADWLKRDHPNWGSYVFNYSRNEVVAFLNGGSIHFAEEYHTDGERTDGVASAVHQNFWRPEHEWIGDAEHPREGVIPFLQQRNQRIKARAPGFLTIAEDSSTRDNTGPASQGGFGFDLKWGMGWMNDSLSWWEQPFDQRGPGLPKITSIIGWWFTQRHVCALSHDEVMNGKGSMLDKSPGRNLEEKLQDFRLLLGWQMMFPGHKLTMMGMEFGQPTEWNVNASLPWELLQKEPHAKTQAYVRDLNALYQSEPGLHVRQYDPTASEIVHTNHRDAVFALLRRGERAEDDVLCLFNAKPVEHRGYRVGVEQPGTWAELINSDLRKYGGTGLFTPPVEAKASPKAQLSHGDEVWSKSTDYTLRVNLPPLSAVAFKPARTEAAQGGERSAA